MQSAGSGQIQALEAKWHCFPARNDEIEKPIHCNWLRAMQFSGDTTLKRRRNSE